MTLIYLGQWPTTFTESDGRQTVRRLHWWKRGPLGERFATLELLPEWSGE